MAELVRVSMSIEKGLHQRFDALVDESRCENRSEFFRDMIRERLVAQEWRKNAEVVGTITLIFDHHRRQLSERITHLQHDHHELILASTHVHLDAHLCAEMILVKGAAKDVKHIADELRQQKGILHTALSMSSTGAALR